MTFAYKSYSEAEIKSLTIMERGIYAFEVIEVHTTDKYHQPMKDKNSNALFTVKLKITDKNGRIRYLTDYLSAGEGMAFKLRHFCSTIGLLDLYDSDSFQPGSALGKKGKCEIIIRTAQPKKDQPGEFWPESNSVKDYVKSDADAIKSQQAKIDTGFMNDDIPDLR